MSIIAIQSQQTTNVVPIRLLNGSVAYVPQSQLESQMANEHFLGLQKDNEPAFIISIPSWTFQLTGLMLTGLYFLGRHRNNQMIKSIFESEKAKKLFGSFTQKFKNSQKEMPSKFILWTQGKDATAITSTIKQKNTKNSLFTIVANNAETPIIHDSKWRIKTNKDGQYIGMTELNLRKNISEGWKYIKNLFQSSKSQLQTA